MASFSETVMVDIDKRSAGRLAGAAAFKLYDTYGLALDEQEEMAREQGLAIDTSVPDDANPLTPTPGVVVRGMSRTSARSIPGAAPVLQPPPCRPIPEWVPKSPATGSTP